MLSEPKPTMLSTRSRISPAALLVKVIARMFHGFTPTFSIRYAIRLVSTLVFPEPAPARISTGPSVVNTPFFCCSLSVSYRLIASILSFLKNYNLKYIRKSHIIKAFLDKIRTNFWYFFHFPAYIKKKCVWGLS